MKTLKSLRDELVGRKKPTTVDSREERHKEQLLNRAIDCQRELLTKYVGNKVPANSSEAQTLCGAIELILLHDIHTDANTKIKGMFAAVVGRRGDDALTMSASSHHVPVTTFWELVRFFSQKFTIAQINGLPGVDSDVARCRVWVRLMLNERQLDNYIKIMLEHKSVMRSAYNPGAFMIDEERSAKLEGVLSGLSSMEFALPLVPRDPNQWPAPPATLNLLSPQPQAHTSHQQHHRHAPPPPPQQKQQQQRSAASSPSTVTTNAVASHPVLSTSTASAIAPAPVSHLTSPKMVRPPSMPPGEPLPEERAAMARAGLLILEKDQSVVSMESFGSHGFDSDDSEQLPVKAGSAQLAFYRDDSAASDTSEPHNVRDPPATTTTTTASGDSSSEPVYKAGPHEPVCPVPNTSTVDVVHHGKRRNKKTGPGGGNHHHHHHHHRSGSSTSALSSTLVTDTIASDDATPSHSNDADSEESMLFKEGDEQKRVKNEEKEGGKEKEKEEDGTEKQTCQGREDDAGGKGSSGADADVAKVESAFREPSYGALFSSYLGIEKTEETSGAVASATAVQPTVSASLPATTTTLAPSVADDDDEDLAMESVPVAPTTTATATEPEKAAVTSEEIETDGEEDDESEGQASATATAAVPVTSAPPSPATLNPKSDSAPSQLSMMASTIIAASQAAVNSSKDLARAAVSVVGSVIHKDSVTSATSGNVSDDDFTFVDEDDELATDLVSVAYDDQRTLALLKHVYEICPEKGMDLQDYKCAGCEKMIGVVFGEGRVCDYNGMYYCSECHRNELQLIPSRILHNWDFRRYPVCRANVAFLNAIRTQPLFCIGSINPKLYGLVDELSSARKLRIQVCRLRQFIFTCRSESAKVKMRRALWPREYLMESEDMYSLQDLEELPSGVLSRLLRAVANDCVMHVIKCSVCREKGFFCEVCRAKEVIFPFDITHTTVCGVCNSVFHIRCFKADECPKCIRRQSRNKK